MTRALLALAVVIALIVAVVALGRRDGGPGTGTQDDTEKKAGTPEKMGMQVLAPARVVIECENPLRMDNQGPDGQAVFKIGEAHMGAHIGYLEIPDQSIENCALKEIKDKPELMTVLAHYEFEVPRDDEYYLFLRAKWYDNCGDSVSIRMDDGSWLPLSDTLGRISDTNYRWAWHPLTETGGRPKPLRLSAGKHTLTLAPREDGPLLDKFLIATDANTPDETVVNP